MLEYLPPFHIERKFTYWHVESCKQLTQLLSEQDASRIARKIHTLRASDFPVLLPKICKTTVFCLSSCCIKFNTLNLWNVTVHHASLAITI